ncbi:MAG: signal peptidase I [Bryobacteraceae bacterium]|jgi:signal peptidase I
MASAEVTPTVEPVAPLPTPPLRALFHWMRDLTLSVVIAVMVILFLYQPVKVEGTSMMPALVDQERIFINKFLYRSIGSVQRGDMVVFWYPRDPSKSYIKRVIGIPGDQISIDRGAVIVNGAPLHEAYVPPEYEDQQSMAQMVVQPDEYFVLGDHRSSSNDSRAWGTVPRHYIYGKAVFVYWPLDKLGLLK